MSVRDRIRQLELQSRANTPVKPGMQATPLSKLIEISPAVPSMHSAMASPAPVESDFENFEDAEEDRPGLNQRLLFLKHPRPPLSNLFD